MDNTSSQWRNVVSVVMITVWICLEMNHYRSYGPWGLYTEFRIIDILFAVICSIIATRKGRGLLPWFAWGLWFSVISVIVLLFLKKLYKGTCIYCNRELDEEVITCPYCNNPPSR